MAGFKPPGPILVLEQIIVRGVSSLQSVLERKGVEGFEISAKLASGAKQTIRIDGVSTVAAVDVGPAAAWRDSGS